MQIITIYRDANEGLLSYSRSSDNKSIPLRIFSDNLFKIKEQLPFEVRNAVFKEWDIYYIPTQDNIPTYRLKSKEVSQNIIASRGGGGRGPKGDKGDKGDPAEETCFEDGIGFEACQQINTEAPNNASGDHSLAIGSGTISAGEHSHSEGALTQANGIGSHSEGVSNISNGLGSHTEGALNTSDGLGSHAEGAFNQANGLGSHAEGVGNLSNGDFSHSEGNGTQANGTQANGTYSHSEGKETIADGSSGHAEGAGTLASGIASHAEGNLTQANGDESHAEGNGSIAGAFAAHAEGASTLASGIASHAEGDATQALGDGSHAEGNSTIAEAFSSHSGGTGAKAYHTSEYARASGTFAVNGDAQYMFDSQRIATTDATPSELFIDGVAERLTIPSNTSWKFTVNLIAVDIANGDTLSRQFQGAIKNVAGATTVLANLIPAGVYETQSAQDAGLPTATAIIDTAASAANDALVITVTGEAAKTIRWMAKIEIVQVQY